MTKETVWLLTELVEDDYHVKEWLLAVFKQKPTTGQLEKYIEGESTLRSKLVYDKGSDIELGRHYWYSLEEKEVE